MRTTAATVRRAAPGIGRRSSALVGPPAVEDGDLHLLHRFAAPSGAGIPCSPLHTLGELAAHPHSQASWMIRSLHDPAIGDWQTVSQPLRFDGQRATPHRPPPSHGADARAVLAAAGMTDEEIAALIAAGVVGR